MLNRNNEIWKDILGYEKRYQVSTLGRIRSIQNNHGHYRELIKATWVSNKGYVYTDLFIKDVKYNISVHSAVAVAFIPNPDQKLTVNHSDGNKQNNHLSNLEWMTYSENHKHAYETGLRVAQTYWKGKKWGNTSKHHNVSYDAKRDRWVATLKVNGKSNIKHFTVKKHGDNAENLAAVAVNDLLDLHGINDRARNIIS